MKLIWITFLFSTLFYAILSNFLIDTELLATSIVLIHIMIVLVSLFRIKGKLGYIISSGFIIRLFLLFWDIYMKHIYTLPHSGEDTETFLRRAISISDSFQIITQSPYEFFIRMLAYIIHFTTEERIFLQYINVLFGLSSIYLVYKILKLLNVKYKNLLLGTIIVSFFPHTIIFSSILLREMASSFFVLLSTYYLIRWFFSNRKYEFILSIIFVLISALFHSGTIFLVFSHLFILIFYNSYKLSYIIRPKSIILFFILIFASISFFTLFDWQNLDIFRKLRVSGINDVYEVINDSRGQSAYLTNLEINNLVQLIFYFPIFFIYFILSPMPYNIRNFNDLFAFTLDGMIVTYFIAYIILKFKSINKNKKVIILALIIGLISILSVFAIGVQNAGTALRHRNKLIYPLIILFILTKDLVERRKTNELQKY